MKKKIVFILFLSFIFTSCDAIFKFLDEYNYYVENVYFQSENYSVMEGNNLICSLIIEPADSFDYYSAEFSILNTDIAFIKSSNGKSCTVLAKKKGSTVISARINGIECKAIINVN
ncbi:MAG: hypothetical protein SOW31_11150 [Treponema sp.]|nr:hypothetical protein [Treponema sp.]